MDNMSLPKTALLIIDMQQGLFYADAPPFNREQVLNNINLLIANAREAGAPIWAVRHTGPEGSPIAAGTANWQLIESLAINPQLDNIFDKTKPSCFYQTGLAEALTHEGVSELVIVGMKTQYCIDTNCRSAAELGWQVVLADDAHTCMDTAQLSAEAIIAHHNATLQGAFVRLAKSADIVFR